MRQQIIDLVRRTPDLRDLAQKFEPTDETICNWMGKLDRDERRRSDALTTAEHKEQADFKAKFGY